MQLVLLVLKEQLVKVLLEYMEVLAQQAQLVK